MKTKIQYMDALLLLTSRQEASYPVCNFGGVCLSVCQMTTFDSLDEESSFSHCRCISREYGPNSYETECHKVNVKVTQVKRYKIPIPAITSVL